MKLQFDQIPEMALERTGGKGASFRSRRIAALLPDLEQHLADEEWCRNGYRRLLTVLDYVSGMTDSYAVSLYQKLKGISI